MLKQYNFRTDREDFINITPQLREAVSKSGITSGHAIVFFQLRMGCRNTWDGPATAPNETNGTNAEDSLCNKPT